MNILLLGSGGREHAMAWKIAQSPLCSKLYIAPGNAGTALCGENVAIRAYDFDGLKAFAREKAVNMVVVGPEEPLVKGIADCFVREPDLRDILFVGPKASGARLEGSKAFSKAFMQRHQIPTASHRSFNMQTIEQGRAYLRNLPPPYVLKADGLAAGKGVIICQSLHEAIDTLEEMLGNEMFGEASATVVVETFLRGKEVSVFVITDGHSYLLLPEAKDYKRVGEEDTGPNTGGMGAVSPVPFAGKTFMEKVENRIIKPTIKGLSEEGIPYCGFIFFGLIEVQGEPFVIEYNARLGDPEAEAILPRIKSDFVALLVAAASSKLDTYKLEVDRQFAATVVLASGGYPGNYEKAFPITGMDQTHGCKVFLAGAKTGENGLQTDGGRVAAITSLGISLPAALDKSYQNAQIIDFKGKFYRRDIGKDLLK